MHEIHRPDLQTLASLAPHRLNTFIHTGWIDSVTTARPVNANGKPIPWFTYPAIDFLESKINPAWTVLEWGCGNSTLWWAAQTTHVQSVEHNTEWHQKITAILPDNANITLIETLSEYANPKIAGLFDVIVIDGEERNACAQTACTVAKPSSIIVFDNSDRNACREGLTFLARRGWKRIDFFGLVPSYAYRTCTSVFYRDESLLIGQQLPCDFESSLGPTLSQVLGE